MFKKILIAAVAVLGTSLATAGDYTGPVGYPGNTWGYLTFPSSAYNAGVEKNNWIYQGKLTQGIDWFNFGVDDQWVFDTYASVGLSVDRLGIVYNNKVVPAVGARMTRKFSKGSVDFGVEGLYERHFGKRNAAGELWRDVGPSPEKGARGYGVQGYVSYWFGWDGK